jgi:pyruvate kinase
VPAITKSQQISSLLSELRELHESCLAMEREFRTSVAEACPQSRHSVQNLLHYLALRKHDLRELQVRLAGLGLSSLGRSESSTLAGIESVIAILETLAAERSEHLQNEPRVQHEGRAFKSGSAILAAHADHLLGVAPKGREVRIMVTMPTEAAESYELVKSLVETGMDVMRVNCAHDSEREWEAMIANAHRANGETGKHCKVLMDLAGPKLRTGPIRQGHHVVRWKVVRDACGAVVSAAKVGLVGKRADLKSLPPTDAMLPVTETLLTAVRLGDTLQIKDSLGRKRKLTIIHKSEHACVGECQHGAYVLSRAEWALAREGKEVASGHIGDVPFVEEPIRLCPGDTLVLTRTDNERKRGGIPHISCTLPEVFSTAQVGQPIFFDDGKIEGIIREMHPDREVHPDEMTIEIVHAKPGGEKLGSAKGINLPETEFGIGALTEKDRHDLDFVAEHADIAGLSFVRRPEDVIELQKELAARGKSALGIILKIESRPGFDQLPLIMIAALRHHPVGIMVARGDLAIEVGFERLAEIQEEILWLSEAAHIPVIWATQVLETLAKTGIPSRAEVTDAAMGVRAECVMLNKGEHILEAVRFLDHILHKMQKHHLKKRSMLRRLAVAQVGVSA